MKRYIRRPVQTRFLMTFALFLGLAAMPAGAQPTAPAVPEPATDAIETPAPSTPAMAAAPVDSPAEPGYDGKPIDPSKPVVVRIISPRDDEVLDTNSVDIFLAVDNYRLAAGGNRLRIILNNENPREIEDTEAPVVIPELSQGGHTLRAYAVDPSGKALTNPEAFAMAHFFIRKKDFQNFVDRKAPLLTVNCPLNGKMDISDDDPVYLDFLVFNAPLGGDGYSIHYKLNQKEEYLATAEPVAWKDLKPGRYELLVRLVDKHREPIPGQYNQVVRTFDVRPVVKPSAVDDTPNQAGPLPEF
jgi:hypothetical protein